MCFFFEGSSFFCLFFLMLFMMFVFCLVFLIADVHFFLVFGVV